MLHKGEPSKGGHTEPDVFWTGSVSLSVSLLAHKSICVQKCVYVQRGGTGQWLSFQNQNILKGEENRKREKY